MAEINKVPGLFPRRMAMSLPSTVRPEDHHVPLLMIPLTFSLCNCYQGAILALESYALSSLLYFSHDVHTEPKGPVGDSRDRPGPRHAPGPGRKGPRPPPLTKMRRRRTTKRPRTSSVWCAAPVTTSRYVQRPFWFYSTRRVVQNHLTFLQCRPGEGQPQHCLWL